MYKVGIIGFGWASRAIHVPGMRQTGKFDVKVVADIRPDDGSAAAMGIEKYVTDPQLVIDDPELDVIMIGSTHDVHASQCIAAMKAGKHVIVEKPIARNLQEAAAMVEAAERTGKTFMVAMCERFDPHHQYIKQLLEEGQLGKPLSARIDHYQNFNPAPDSWWRSKEKVGGGAVIGSGVHRLDLLRWYFGEPVKVYANGLGNPDRLEADACVHAVITFGSGVVANFSINWSCNQFLYGEGVSITGTEGTVVKQDGLIKLGLRQEDNGILKDVCPDWGESMHGHFLRCIETGETPMTGGVEGYKSLQLVRAIYQSMETGEIVDPATVTF